MKRALPRLLIASLALLVWSSPIPSEASEVWRRFQPPKQSFSIRMPGSIARTRRVTRTPIGTAATDVWTSKIDTAEVLISITDLPAMATWFKSEEGLYDKTLENMMEELGAELGRVEKLDHGPFGRRVFYRIPARDGVPARSGRALIGVRDATIVVVNGIVLSGGEVELEEIFRGLSMDGSKTLALAD